MQYKILCIITISLLFLSGCSRTATGKALAHAKQLYHAGKMSEALITVDHALQSSPEHQSLLTMKLRILDKTHQYEEVIQLRPHIRNTEKQLPFYVRALLQTGQLPAAQQLIDLQKKQHLTADRRALQGELDYLNSAYDEALYAFDEALKQNPTHQDALVNKATTLADAGMFFEALDLFDVALDHYPDDARIRYNKATVLSDLGYQQKNIIGTGAFSYYSEALRHFEKAYTLDPTTTHTLVWLGITYLDLGAFGNAHDALEIAISKDPTNEDARYYQAKTYLAETQTGAAQEALEKLLTLNPSYQLSPEERALVASDI